MSDAETELDLDSDQRRLERRILGALAMGVVVALAGLALTIWVFFLWNRASDAQETADETEEAVNAVSAGLDVMREQVKALGQVPVVPPAEDIVEDVETGGEPVLIPGPQGEQGAQGEQGPGPTPEAIQAAVDAHCAQQPGGTCEGPAGPPGQEGAAGAAGSDGVSVIGASVVDCHLIIVFSDASSTDVGDVCGPPGADGQPGPQGEPGLTTCPEGFVFTEVTIPSSPETVFLICARSG